MQEEMLFTKTLGVKRYYSKNNKSYIKAAFRITVLEKETTENKFPQNIGLIFYCYLIYLDAQFSQLPWFFKYFL